MNYLLLVVLVLLQSGLGICVKPFNLKTKDEKRPTLWYLIFMSGAALVVSLAFCGFRPAFHLGTVLSAAAFAVLFESTIILEVLAMRHGPLSLTSLMVSYSLFIPTLYGIIFLREKISVWLVIGVVLLAVSIAFISLVKKGAERSASLKWGIYAGIMLICNGVLGVVQKRHQIDFPGLYQKEFVAYSMIFVFLMTVVLLLVTRSKPTKVILSAGGKFAAPAGAMCGLLNMLVLYLSPRVPASLMYPFVSAGVIVVSSVAAVLLYREKLTRNELIGLIIGAVSVVFICL
ncbi:MAG: EamA family transporter [Clostridia bacterium]|nr:EamA family transporter [Clostridia bacterium]